MEALYHQTNRIIQETQQYFQHLNNTTTGTDDIENEIQTKIVAVTANCDRLDILVFKVPPAQRPQSKMRVDQLKYDIRHLQAALTNWQQKKYRRQAEIDEREQLLNRKFASNSETSIDIDYGQQHQNSMNSAHRGVDEMIMTGSNALENLRSQRETLKGAQKRLIDVGNMLGLSNHTMKMIERRIVDDKYVMIGGMIFTLTVVILIIYYFVL